MPSIMAMGLQFDSMIIIPTTVLAIIILSLIFTNRSYKRLPPGPWKLPIIGNLHNLTGLLPHHILRDLSQKYGPLMHLQMGQISAVVVSSPSIAREVLKTHDLSFAQRPQLIAGKYAAYDDLSIAFAPYGEYWKQMKKVCVLELLSPARVSSFARMREEEVSNFVESICSSQSLVNLTEQLLTLMSIMTSRAAFGEKIKFGDGFDLITGIEEGSEMATGFNLADLFPSFKFLESVGNMRAKLEKIHVKVDKILQALVDNRIEEMRKEEDDKIEKEDLIHTLLKIKQSGSLKVPITLQHIKAVIFDMFIAGTDTSAKAVEWAMAEMMKHPAVMKKAQEEVRRVSKGKKKINEHDISRMTYLKSVLKESLRLHPPAPLMIPRECREVCKINGYEIPLRTKVIINAWAMARDPSYWENPEIFWPERFVNSSIDYKGSDFEFIPFGAGRRVCPGMHFGMVAAELVLAHMLYHFNWELPSGMKPEDLDMSEQFGASVGRKMSLCLRAIPFEQLIEW